MKRANLATLTLTVVMLSTSSAYAGNIAMRNEPSLAGNIAMRSESSAAGNIAMRSADQGESTVSAILGSIPGFVNFVVGILP